jgi:low affinity Fe/Cu permease
MISCHWHGIDTIMISGNNQPANQTMHTENLTINAGLTERFAISVTKATGSTGAFILAFILVLVWAISGPFFHYSENWQLVINTGTTIITFLMVFLIQKAQNKDSLAVQLKLNELVAAHEFASNRLVNVENLSEEELKIIQKYYSGLSRMTKKEESLQQSHSIDEAENMNQIKKERESDIIGDLNKKPDSPVNK